MVKLAIGSRGWEGEFVSTPSWGTTMAALPCVGQSIRATSVVVVDVDEEVDDVEAPGAVEVVDVVGGGGVVVVGVPAVGELAPTSRAKISAPSARGISTKRPNLEGNDAFTPANLQSRATVSRYFSAVRVTSSLRLGNFVNGLHTSITPQPGEVGAYGRAPIAKLTHRPGRTKGPLRLWASSSPVNFFDA